MKVRISGKERDLLGRIGLHADKSLREISRLSKHHLHTARYTISKLEDRKILNRAWVIDVFQLGWQRVQILFSVGDADRNKVTEFLKARRRVVHVAEIGGEYDFDIVILARGTHDTLCLMRDASQACGNIFVSKAVVMQNCITYFPRKYLCKGKPHYGALVVGGGKPQYEVDEVEQRILEALMESPMISRKDLAEKLSLSIPTVGDRLKKLRQSGVLVGAMFSPRYIELGVQNYKILLSTCDSNQQFRDELYKFSYHHPHCTSYREGIGAWDYELNAEVESHAELTALKNDLWHHFGSRVGGIQIIPRFKMHKFMSYPVMGKKG